MQNLENVVMQLKDSVGRLNKLAALGCKCQQQKMNISKTVETSKRPSSPISITSNRSSSSDVDSEPDRVSITLNILQQICCAVVAFRINWYSLGTQNYSLENIADIRFMPHSTAGKFYLAKEVYSLYTPLPSTLKSHNPLRCDKLIVFPLFFH